MEITKEKGCVYFFRHIGLTPIKIGYSEDASPINRFNQFKTYAPFGSEIIGFIQTFDAKQIESILHRKYSSKRLKGEWFEISIEDCNSEIDFYSNIEDVKERNEFQIQWAKYLDDKQYDSFLKFKAKDKTKKDKIMSAYKSNPNFNRSHLAENLGCSRQYVIRALKKVI